MIISKYNTTRSDVSEAQINKIIAATATATSSATLSAYLSSVEANNTEGDVDDDEEEGT